MWVANAALSILAVGLSTGSAYVIVRRTFGERSLAIRVGLSVGFAIVGQAFGLLWLPMIIPVGWAAMATSAILVGAAIFVSRTSLAANVPQADQSTSKDRKSSLLNLVLIVLGSVLVYISALAYWMDGTAGRADVATLFQHSALAATISRGNFPVVNMFEPDFPMSYRFNFHTLAASAQHLTGLTLDRLMPHFVALISVSLFWTAAAVVGRVVRDVRMGILAGGLIWSAGPLYWLGAPSLIESEGWATVLSGIAREPESITWSGLILGPTFTMATHNPTNIFGLIPTLIVLLLIGELISGKHSLRSVRLLSILLGVSLTVLAAASEYFYMAVVSGTAAVIVFRFLRKRSVERITVALMLSAAVISAALSLTTSSVLANLARGADDVLRLGVYFNDKGAGRFSSWGYNSMGPFFEWAESGQHEVGAFSLEFLIDGGLPLYLLIPVLLWVAFKPNSRAAPYAAVSAAAFSAATLFHFQQSPPEIARFTNFGATTAIIAFLVWIRPALGSTLAPLRIAVKVALGAGALVLIGGFVLSALAWPQMIGQAEVRQEQDEAAVIEYLNGTEVSDRLLILWGSRTAFDLYDPRTPQVSAYISAYTGQFIPYGYHHLSKAEQYSGPYGWAQESLDPEMLDSLRIRYIYVDPSRLTEKQRQGLDSLRADGSLDIAMTDERPSGALRVLYSYSPRPDTGGERPRT